jgi:nicotinamide-nucleotide amidase
MKSVIISCGTEIVTGQCVDTNSAWLSQRLTAGGVEVIAHTSVGDDLERISDAIRRGRAEADLVIITGGLGPTRDDVTRDAVAMALERPLQENAEALAQITEFFRRWQREMPESNRVQAMIPQGCEVIPNPRGTAPGIAYIETAGASASPLTKGGIRGVVALPGVPAEMKAMYEAYVAPRIGHEGGPCTLSARLHCFGISEAKVGETLADLMARGRNPLVGTTASQAVITVRILASGENGPVARTLLDTDRSEIGRRLGSVVFGEEDDTLHSVVARLLLERRQTVATAESCTGGLLGKLLTDVPGSSAYFLRGYIVYSNEAKRDLLGVPVEMVERHGTVSEEVARHLASSARVRAASNVAVSITGIAGPGGGSQEKPVGLVYIGLAHAEGTEVRRILFGDHLAREEIRDRSCKTALNMLRIKLLS